MSFTIAQAEQIERTAQLQGEADRAQGLKQRSPAAMKTEFRRVVRSTARKATPREQNGLFQAFRQAYLRGYARRRNPMLTKAKRVKVFRKGKQLLMKIWS